MKKITKQSLSYLFLFMLFTSTAQESDRRSEMGFHMGFGGFQSIEYSSRDTLGYPDYFPYSDSLQAMGYDRFGLVANFPVGINYAHWMNFPKSERWMHGIVLNAGLGGRLNNYEDYTREERFTYDTLISQSTGGKYPVDSIYESRYRIKTTGTSLIFGFGYSVKYVSKRLDILIGTQVNFRTYAFQYTDYTYSKIGASQSSYDQYMFEYPNFNGISSISTRKKSNVGQSQLGITLPLEFRFHREEQRDLDMMFVGKMPRGVLGIQIVPGFQSLRFDNLRTTYFSCSLGLNWVFDFKKLPRP